MKLKQKSEERERERTVMSVYVSSPPRVDVIPWFQALSSYSAHPLFQFSNVFFSDNNKRRIKKNLKIPKGCFQFLVFTNVGAEGEGAERVGGEVVEDGVGGAVEFQGEVAGVEAAAVAGEGDVGGAEVGAVEDHHLVVVHYLHVHGGDAYAALQLNPVATSTC